MHTQEAFHGAFQRMLERLLRRELEFNVSTINKSVHTKTGNLFNDPRICIYIYIPTNILIKTFT